MLPPPLVPHSRVRSDPPLPTPSRPDLPLAVSTGRQLSCSGRDPRRTGPRRKRTKTAGRGRGWGTATPPPSRSAGAFPPQLCKPLRLGFGPMRSSPLRWWMCTASPRNPPIRDCLTTKLWGEENFRDQVDTQYLVRLCLIQDREEQLPVDF